MEQIGKITKPQGILGEFRAVVENISKDALKKLKEVKINNIIYPVIKVVFREGFVVFRVEGITDRNQVELLRNVPIFADADNSLEDDEILISDIIGFDVVVNDEKLGVLKSIEDYGASEIYVVESDHEIMFPNARGVIKEFNLDKKQIVLDSKILEEIRIDN